MNKSAEGRRLRCLALTIFIVLLGIIGAGCAKSYRSTAEVSVSAGDLVYLRDHRTGLCFAVLALQNPAGTSVTEMAMTPVPCENLEGVETR